MNIELTSKYIVLEQDIKHGQNIKFLDEGSIEATQFGDKLMFQVRLPNGKEKTLRMNESSKKNMVEVYGADSAKWVGQEARVNIKMTKMGKAILLTHPNKDADGNVVIQ